MELKTGFQVMPLSIHLHNCEVFTAQYREINGTTQVCLEFNFPKDYKKKDAKFFLNTHNSLYLFNSKKQISSTNNDYILLNL